jgi:formylmethanofuran dehydrogenase subunit E
MALHGLEKLGLENHQETRDKLVVFVETDRCLPDAIELVTGCRLGNRRLKHEDMGKMAATLVDLKTCRAIRVAAREEANQHAIIMYPHLEREEALQEAYCRFPDSDLFRSQFVRVDIAPEDLPGYQSPRVSCTACGESIAFGRQRAVAGKPLCRSCAGQSYYKEVRQRAG